MKQEICINCGVRFDIPDTLQRSLKNCKNSFYCPNGHVQHYTGKSEEEKLREERDKYLGWYRNLQERAVVLTRSNSALRGVITRMKNKGSG